MHEMVQVGELLKLLLELVCESFLIAKLAVFRHPFTKHYGWWFSLDHLKTDFEKLSFSTREWDIYFKVYIWRRIVRHITIFRTRMCLAVLLFILCFVQLTLGGLWSFHIIEKMNHSSSTVSAPSGHLSGDAVSVETLKTDDVSEFLEEIFVWGIKFFFGWPLVLLALITYVAQLVEPEVQFLLQILHPLNSEASVCTKVNAGQPTP